MKTFRVLLLLLFIAFRSGADIPYNGWWQKANRFYSVKQYDSAVAYYGKIAAVNPANPEVYFNLGNSYYRLNNIGSAVLNYERSLKLDPNNKKTRDNLSLTEARIQNRIVRPPDIFFVSWWKSVTAPSLAGLWAIVSLILFLVLLSLLLMKRWGKAPGWLRPQISLLLTAVFMLTLFFSYVAGEKQTSRDEAVVMEPNAPIYANPGDAKTLSLVPEGTVIETDEIKKSWVKVQLPDGKTGWMENNALEKI
jgi:tetratricopeptide (TPR) repeat protein